VSDVKGWATGACGAGLMFCCGSGNGAQTVHGCRPPTLTESRPRQCGCTYPQCRDLQDRNAFQTCSVHRCWSNGAGRPLEVPLCCLYSYSHCEISGGKQNLVALVFFFFHLPFFSTVYYCRSDVLTKTKPFIVVLLFLLS